MPKGFTEQEKINIREKLVAACTEFWTKQGYRKTNVDELCKRAGISKGGFYLFFNSKEELFGEVLCLVQWEIYEAAQEMIRQQPGKDGATAALRYVYRAYDENNFLYNSDCADYILLLSKLTPEQLGVIREMEEKNRRLFLDVPHLKLKISEELAASTIYSLIMIVKQKHVLPNHAETFDFMAEKLVEHIYEEC